MHWVSFNTSIPHELQADYPLLPCTNVHQSSDKHTLWDCLAKNNFWSNVQIHLRIMQQVSNPCVQIKYDLWADCQIKLIHDTVLVQFILLNSYELGCTRYL